MSIQHELNNLRLIWSVLSGTRRRQLFILLILSLITAFSEVANIGALLPFLTLLANPKEGIKPLGPVFQPLQQLPDSILLFLLGISFILIVILSTVLRSYTIRKQLRLTAFIGSDIGDLAFSSIISKPYSWHLEHNSSAVLSRITNDVNILNGTIQALLVINVNLFILIILGTSLVLISPAVMLLYGSLLSSFYIATFYFTRKSLSSDGRKNTNLFQSSLAVAQSALGGIRDVLLDETQSYFIDAYSSRNQNYRLALASINVKAQIPRFLIEGFSIVLIISLSLVMTYRGETIENQLPLLGILVLGSYRLLQPLQQCFAAVGTLQSSQASLDRLKPFFIRPRPRPISVHNLDVSPSRPVLSTPLIEFRDVSFRYHSNSPIVLQGINLSINAGERIAIVGSSGSGKSTISDLILGLLKPTQGHIFVNGYDTFTYNDLMPAWQKCVSHVPQQIYLSDQSFEQNIAFGVHHSQIDRLRVMEAARLAQIDQLIESSENSYSTIVGERGVKLSGGQRQRVGIARALHKRADLLVLDEATSSLDNETESQVMNSIYKLDHTFTILIIAHRISTIEQCDRIFILSKGKIVGIGNFEELSNTNYFFQRLIRKSNSFNS